MSSSPARRLLRLPHALSQRASGARKSHRERDFSPLLRFDPEAPQLILSPHWDDAVLSCWSVLTGQRDVQVVNLFAGVPQPGQAGVWEAVSGCADSAERARARMTEDALALARAGRTAMNLALLDISFRRRRPEPSLAALDGALASHVQSASRVFAPAGIGAHADHVLARRYGRALAHTGIPVELYAELPYCIFHGWPAWVDGQAREPNRDVDAYWQSFLRGVPEMPALDTGEVMRLDAAASAAKLAAIDCYRLSLNHAVRQLLADATLNRFEVRWQLSPHGAFTPPHHHGR
jgi:hypothetical protein